MTQKGTWSKKKHPAQRGRKSLIYLDLPNTSYIFCLESCIFYHSGKLCTQKEDPLVDGWTKPLWKFISHNGNLPQNGVNIWNIWNHHPVLTEISNPPYYHSPVLVVAGFRGWNPRTNVVRLKALWQKLWLRFKWMKLVWEANGKDLASVPFFSLFLHFFVCMCVGVL